MSLFTAAEAAALAGATVRVADLIEFEFETATKRLWNGNGDLPAGGQIWQGIAGLGTIDGLGEQRGPVAEKATFTLSGVDAEILAAAIAESSEVEGRTVTVYLQLFDDAWQTTGPTIPIWVGLMRPPRISRTLASDGGSAVQSVTIPAENLFVGRSRPPAGRFTDRDQKTRFAGDLFWERAPDLVSKSITWPDY